MSADVLCLRPLADFTRVGVTPPDALNVVYRAPADHDIRDLVREVRAIVMPAVGPKVEAALFDDARIDVVQITGAGVDRLDRDALMRKGIAVANVPGGSNAAVAEYAVTMASLLLRRFTWADTEIHAGSYAQFRARLLADNIGGLEDCLVGVVGLGTIGNAVARAFASAGCRIAYYDPAVESGEADRGFTAQAMALDGLLRSCDVVTLHVPLVEQTRNLIDARALSLMQPHAVLINASRGGVVDESALARQLESGKLGGAAVDVYSTEPPEAHNPLLGVSGEGARRLILTPHIAGVTRQSSAFLFREAWKNVARVLLDGKPPLYRVY